jgi:hypothetical protein
MGTLNTAFCAPDLTGKVNVIVTDNSVLPTPNTVLVGSKPFFVKADWDIAGLVASAIGGDFSIDFYVESIGNGPEKKLASTQVAANSVAPSANRSYSATLTIPAGALTDGLYKTALVLTHKNAGVATPIAGLDEGPMIQITTP